MDVDFVTNKNAYTQLRNLYTARPDLTDIIKNKTLLVIPAFTATDAALAAEEATVIHNNNVKGRKKITPAEAAEALAPRDKQELVEKYEKGLIEPLQLQQFPAKHGPTQFSKWLQEEATPTDPFYPISYEPQFEPVVVAYRHGLPRHWTGFRGHYYNKSSWVAETHRLGFKFAVLRNLFVVHDRSTPKPSKVPILKYSEWPKFLEYRERIHRGNVTQG